MLYQIVYLSSSSSAVESEDLIEILNESREKNRMNDITGMLMYCGGSFLQVLEGDRDKITRLFEEIKSDGRHMGAFVISQGEIKSRYFDGWHMAFRAMTPEVLHEKTAYRSLLEMITAANSKETPHPSIAFLKSLIAEQLTFEKPEPAFGWINRIAGTF